MPEGEKAPYLYFTNTGEFMGFGGCNYFVGRYRTGDDGRLIVSSLRASHLQCEGTSEQETTLLTSLLLANSMQYSDDGLRFSMNGRDLMKMGEAPTISVDELLQQSKQLKAKKSRPHKSRGKKKKAPGKAKKSGKKGVTKSPGPKLRNASKPALKH